MAIDLLVGGPRCEDAHNNRADSLAPDEAGDGGAGAGWIGGASRRGSARRRRCGGDWDTDRHAVPTGRPDAMKNPPRNGRIVTFYSYKGGTGRSMALANVAWLLASGGRRVLVIDWD